MSKPGNDLNRCLFVMPLCYQGERFDKHQIVGHEVPFVIAIYITNQQVIDVILVSERVDRTRIQKSRRAQAPRP